MRRSSRLVQQLQAGFLQSGTQHAESAVAGASASAVRTFGAPAGDHPKPTTPLSAFMPTVVSLPRKVVTSGLQAAVNMVTGLASSSTIKGAVGNLADKVFAEEALTKVENLDAAYWTSLLGTVGYTNHAGLKNLAEALKPKLAGLEPEDVVGATVAFYKAGFYDKDLFTGIAAHVSAKFQQYETEGLLQVLAAFHANGHYGTILLDDIADSITYCNHYLAPTKVPQLHLALALEAYAKADHERGDLFVTLARGFSELALMKLAPEERKTAAVTALRALHDFQFFPEQTEALLYAARSEGVSLSPEEAAVVDKVQAAAEDAAGGELRTYKPGHEDAAHWYGHHTAAPSSYSLYVFRDSLVPTQYSPASMRPLN